MELSFGAQTVPVVRKEKVVAAASTAFFPASASLAQFVYAFTSWTFGVISDYVIKWALSVACNGQDIQIKTTLAQIQHFIYLFFPLGILIN